MAYRFKLDEPISKGFRRIGIEQIDKALAILSGARVGENPIHETRKCLKRVRALLRLLRPSLGDETFRRENDRFRSIAALLSHARDREIMIAAARATAAQVDEEARPLWERVATLVGEAEPAAAAPSLGEATEALRMARREMKRLDTGGGLEILELGLTVSYRQARKRYNRAYETGIDEAFHDWRKSVQYHWRHMSLVQPVWPELFSVRLEEARSLSQILGEDHDLYVLLVHAERELAPHFKNGRDLEQIRIRIRLRQDELRRDARPRGARLFASSARDIGRSTVRMWKAVRKTRAEEKEQEAVDAAQSPPQTPAPRAKKETAAPRNRPRRARATSDAASAQKAR